MLLDIKINQQSNEIEKTARENILTYIYIYIYTLQMMTATHHKPVREGYYLISCAGNFQPHIYQQNKFCIE
jgi:hypothetical protein